MYSQEVDGGLVWFGPECQPRRCSALDEAGAEWRQGWGHESVEYLGKRSLGFGVEQVRNSPLVLSVGVVVQTVVAWRSRARKSGMPLTRDRSTRIRKGGARGCPDNR